MTEYRPYTPQDRQFNPDGALWKVSKERVILLGGSPALLTQLGYPPVPEALRRTGRLEANAVQRLRSNAMAGFNLIFGTVEGNQAIYERINEYHNDPGLQLEISEPVGRWKKGDRFSPRTQEGLGLVGATLIEGSVESYQTFVGPLTDSEKDGYTEEAKTLFEGMGLRKESLPDSYDGVREHIDGMIEDERLAVGRTAMELAPYTMLAHTKMPAFLKEAMRLFALSLLREKLASQYGFKITPGERKAAKRRAEHIRKAVPHMPNRLRYNPQYRVAREALREQEEADLRRPF
jgi:uncharacterized protein (DUF2236 family)